MQIVNFKKIRAINFRSHTEEFELEFEKVGLFGICGKNGKGKSSLLMAIVAAIYGESPEGYELSKLINNKTNKNLELELDFSIDGVDYKIKRYYKHTKYRDQLFLYKNGMNISSTTTTETYKLIESLLVPKGVFMNTIYFGQSIKDFFTALVDSKQKDIFYSILDTKIYEKYYDAAKQLKDKMTLVLNDETNSLSFEQNNKKKYEDLISYINNQINSNIDEINRLTSDNSDLKYDIKKIEAKISDLKLTLVDFDNFVITKTKIENDINNISAQQESLVKQKEKEFEDRKTLLESQYKNEYNTLKQDVEKHHEKIKKDISFKQSELMTKRSTVISKEYELKNKYSEEKNNHKKSVDDKINNINNDKLKISESKNNFLKTFNDQIDKYNVKNFRFKSKIDNLKNINNSKIYDCDNHIAKITKDIDDLNSYLKKEIPECPLCHQKIDEHIQNDLIINLQNKNKELLDYEKTKSGHNKVLERFGKRQAIYSKSFGKIINDLHTNKNNREIEFDNAIKRHDEELDKIKIDLNEFLNSHDSKLKDEIKKYQFELNTVDSELDCLNQEEQSVNNKIIDELKICKDKVTNLFKDEVYKYSQIISEEIKNKKQLFIKNLQDLNLTLTNTSLKIDDLNLSKQNLENLNQQRNELDNSFSSNNNMILSLINKNSDQQSEIEKYKTLIDDCESKINDIKLQIDQQQQICDICDFWKTGFSDKGIPSLLIDSSIPFMNNKVKDILELLAPGKFTISFDTQSETKSGDIREKFNVKILNNENGCNHHSLLSGGEKRQVDVAIMRTLRMLAEKLYQKKFNVTFFDEALDSLDQENKKVFCKYLKTICVDQCIYLITHDIDNTSECDELLKL